MIIGYKFVPTGDRKNSIRKQTPDTVATDNELKEKNKLIEVEKTETGSVST